MPFHAIADSPFLRLRRNCVALLPLGLFFFGLSLASALLGFRSSAYLKINSLLVLFLAPGWWIGRAWRPRSGLVDRFFTASVISFSVYSVLAQVATWLDRSFADFYVAYAAVLLLTGILAGAGEDSPVREVSSDRPRATLGQGLLVAGFVLFLVLAYRVPWSNDIGQFLMQEQDMAVRRSFQPSPIGMTSFGIFEAMPRWRCHVLHLFFSLLAVAANLPVDAVVFQWATIPMSVFAFCALYCFVREVVGREPPAWTILAAQAAPLVVFWREHNAYSCSYRLTNNLCLDKDFALFWLLPAMLCLAWRCLRSAAEGSMARPERSARGHGIALAALAFPAVNFHPMTSIYFAMSVPVLMAGCWPLPIRRPHLFVGGYAAILVASTYFAGDAQEGHQQIDQLTRLDMERSADGRPLHYWVGQYGAIPGHETGTIIWRDGQMRLRSEVFTRNTLLAGSAVMTLVWIAFLLLLPPTRRSREELASLRVQLAYFAGFAAIYWASPWFLGSYPHLYRGYERLHWYFLGFFAFAQTLVHGQAVLMQAVAGARWPMVSLLAHHALPGLFVLFLADQSWALWTDSLSWLSRVPYVHTAFDIPSSEGWAGLRSAAEARVSETGVVPPPPDYLRPEDRIAPLVGGFGRDAYWLQRQSVWWRELYAEAHVLQQRGAEFLGEWNTYYDGVDGRMTPHFIAWMQSQRVNIVLAADQDKFVARLADALDLSARRINREMWRLVPKSTIAGAGDPAPGNDSH
jgi:hypothetical protein